MQSMERLNLMMVMSSFSQLSTSTPVLQKTLCFRGIPYSDAPNQNLISIYSGKKGQYRGQEYDLTVPRPGNGTQKGLKYRGLSY